MSDTNRKVTAVISYIVNSKESVVEYRGVTISALVKDINGRIVKFRDEYGEDVHISCSKEIYDELIQHINYRFFINTD